ncbi:PPC domain-containing DNA-binding protein [Candidatus Zixiibacteriota bacterium]
MLLMSFEGGHVIRIEQGEEVISALSAFCEQENIEAGTFHGIGAVTGARLGYYDHETGEYTERVFEEGMEVVAFSGNISRKAQETLFPHAHIIISNRQMETFGGHCFQAYAMPTLEIILSVIPGALRRIQIPGKAAQLLDLQGNPAGTHAQNM